MGSVLLNIAVGCTIGAIVGFIYAVYKKLYKPDTKLLEKNKKEIEFVKKRSRLITSLAFLILGIGLVWTVYYLVLGLVDPTLTEYATNISQLIVSVLTVFSILIAFYQFLREK